MKLYLDKKIVINFLVVQPSLLYPRWDLNRMAYGELYKGTFKKYKNVNHNQEKCKSPKPKKPKNCTNLSQNMQARDLKLLMKFFI